MRTTTDENARISGRRAVLKAGLGLLGAAVAPGSALARGLARASGREVALFNINTGERIRAEYFQGGKYLPDAMRAVAVLLRDHRTNAVHPIDPKLLDLLHNLHERLNDSGPFSVVSGYRSAETNALMHEASSGVARHSLHMEGRAVDIRLPGARLSAIDRAALTLKLGGVGYYPSNNFVHIDTGAVRHWGA